MREARMLCPARVVVTAGTQVFRGFLDHGVEVIQLLGHPTLLEAAI